MTTQLTFDILQLVTKDIVLAPAGFKDVFNMSLVSKAVHNFTYPLILRVDGIQAHAYIGPRRGHVDYRLSPYTSMVIPQSLRFFLEKDNAELVGLLLDCVGVDHNAVYSKVSWFSSQCETVLCLAIQAGAISVVEFLVRAGANLPCDNKREDPLKLAIEMGSAIITRFLLEHIRLQGQEYNSSQLREHSLQHIEDYCVSPRYSSNGHEMIKILLQYCSDVNETDKDGHTILHHFAIEVNSYHSKYDRIREVINLFVQAGVDVNALSSGGASCGMWIRRTALDYASSLAKADLIQVLLENGASSQGALASDFTGPTVVAVRNPQRRMGVSYGPPTNESQVPLIYAAATPLHGLLWDLHIREGHPGRSGICCNRLECWERIEKSNVCKSAKLLIDHGLVGPQGILDTSHKMLVSTPTICAELRVDWPELWTLLLEADVLNVSHRNEWGQTFLNQLASGCCGKTIIRAPSWKPNLIRALVLGGSDPNTIDNSGMTPLHWAILHGNFDLVKLLVELGANPAKEVNGSTPTHYAFGKPFPRRGPVARKVMASLRQQLIKTLHRSRAIAVWTSGRGRTTETGRIEAFSEYRKCKWHPLLSVCSDSFFMKEQYNALVDDAQKRMLSIMALLSPFEEISRDEHGDTPRNIAENVGLLKGGESLVLHPERSHVQEGSEQVPSYLPHWYSLRSGSWRCGAACPFCLLFPRPLLDLDTAGSRATVLTDVTKDGQIVHLELAARLIERRQFNQSKEGAGHCAR